MASYSRVQEISYKSQWSKACRKGHAQFCCIKLDLLFWEKSRTKIESTHFLHYYILAILKNEYGIHAKVMRQILFPFNVVFELLENIKKNSTIHHVFHDSINNVGNNNQPCGTPVLLWNKFSKLGNLLLFLHKLPIIFQLFLFRLAFRDTKVYISTNALNGC